MVTEVPTLHDPAALRDALAHMWDLSGQKIRALEAAWPANEGAPVFTVAGKYGARGWTDWTQGFQFGSALLQFEATGDRDFLDLGRSRTLDRMAPHLTHFGVHDHGFNIVSTYGNLLRLACEGYYQADAWETEYYKLALKCSGAVQARRWTNIPGGGFIHSFNGSHSLFADTMRTLRSLAIAHSLGQPIIEEQDQKTSLLERLVQHLSTTKQFAVYFGEGRDAYDVRGRVAHESIFNPVNGEYRCPASQQGYSPFTTWTRGLAWVMLGFAEELEYVRTLDDVELAPFGGRELLEQSMLQVASATCDYYLNATPLDGIPFWDTGAPRLHELGDYRSMPSDPFNECEPIDSSAAAIAGQALCRLGHFLGPKGQHYFDAGVAIAERLLTEPYLSVMPDHQGLLLHSIYHRPNGWDYIPPGKRVPCGESSMWGDYHLRELGVYLQRILDGRNYHSFYA